MQYSSISFFARIEIIRSARNWKHVNADNNLLSFQRGLTSRAWACQAQRKALESCNQRSEQLALRLCQLRWRESRSRHARGDVRLVRAVRERVSLAAE